MDTPRFDHRLLIRLRVGRGWAPVKAAAELGLSTTALHNLELGMTHPNGRTLARIARIYGVRMDDFYPAPAAARR